MTAPSTPRSTSLVPTFTGATLDRAADLRADWAGIRRLLSHPQAAVLGASADSVLVTDGASPLLLRRPLEGRVNPYQPILLGLEQDGRPLFAADLDDPEAASHVAETGIGKLMSLRDAGVLLPQAEGGLAAYLVALLNWHRRHRFCSACGSKTRVTEAGLARRCPDCKATHFPRTDPVVIMVVDDGSGNILLGRRIGWPDGRFSILAGYVSTGESPEEAVIREVHEESGILASAPRYVASQPWPFPSSLMLGFEASAPHDDPVPQPGEMVEVRWFSLEEVRAAALAGAGSDPWAARADGGLKLPGEVSIARMLIDAWVARGGRRL